MKHSIKAITLLLTLTVSIVAVAQDTEQSTPNSGTTTEKQPRKYVAVIEEAPKLTFFQGFTLAADLFGPAQYLLSDYGSFEGALRLNLKNTYFPVVELGLATCDSEDANTHIRYKTRAPYIRIGLDYNLLRDKFQDNKLYAGLRYGLSRYNFDISGPLLTDPIWGGGEPFSYKDIAATSHWLEVVVGVQVKVWHSFHMGWSIRYKQTISTTKNRYAAPYFIPGYGTTTHTSGWGASYSLIFDLNWGKKKAGKKHTVTVIERPLDGTLPPAEQPADSIP